MNVILPSHDQRFAVVRSEPWMAEALAEIQEASFPDLAPEEKMRPEHYRSHIEIFPEGQHAVIEVSTGRVAACSTDLRTRIDFGHYQHTYMEAVGHNYLTTHDPKGDWLYGADIGVHPDYRGLGLSTLLYNARHRLVRELGLRGHVAGAMPKGYGAVQEQMPIEVYVQKVVRGELSDPVLSVQLKRGYAVWGIIPDYLEDASCANYGVFIVWRNPEVDS
ncbi:MAG TPA: GNAT family N-acetyltransferase [Meiothermus sp.]|jgi:GNAT superfamily N-acetyltransferase|nr:GNAT family N-acetyltransferase [Meiothermus sp.]